MTMDSDAETSEPGVDPTRQAAARLGAVAFALMGVLALWLFAMLWVDRNLVPQRLRMRPILTVAVWIAALVMMVASRLPATNRSLI